MPNPATPSAPTPAGDDRRTTHSDANPIGPSFEDRLRQFWQSNSRLVLGVLIAVLVAIVAKGGWEYLQAEKEKEIRAAYAAASTPAQLKAFAASHSEHPLAGAAQLRMADDAYAEGKFTDAIGLYEQAIETLEVPVLDSRARMGIAMAKLQGGRVAEGETALKSLAADANEVKAFRVEAMYHLAVHAVESGKPEDVKTYSEQLMQLDPTSPWTQRAMMLRAAEPAPTAVAPTATTPASDTPMITVPGAKK